MKKIAFVSTARSEFNASRYVIKAIADDPEFEMVLLEAGPDFLEYDAQTKEFAVMTVSQIMWNISNIIENHKPDLLIINGDRIELMSVALAATIHGIPLAHIGGGDVTFGSLDNLHRYAISRYAHLHLVSDEQAAQNLIQSGEEPERIFVVGQCGLENIARTPKLSLEETSKAIGLDLSIPTALCIYYPSIEPGISVQEQIYCILSVLDRTKQQTVFVHPCAELGSDVIIKTINEYCKDRPNSKAFANLENQVFQSVLWYSRFMIGNSSAGMIEAPYLRKWTINIGDRQKGRHSPETIINTGYSLLEISKAINHCLHYRWPSMTTEIDFSSQRIVQVIKENIDKPDLLYKKILLGG